MDVDRSYVAIIEVDFDVEDSAFDNGFLDWCSYEVLCNALVDEKATPPSHALSFAVE